MCDDFPILELSLVNENDDKWTTVRDCIYRFCQQQAIGTVNYIFYTMYINIHNLLHHLGTVLTSKKIQRHKLFEKIKLVHNKAQLRVLKRLVD